MDRAVVRIVDGPFAGFEGELASVDGDRVLVRVTLFGREAPVELHRDQVEDPDDAIVALRRPTPPGEDAVALLRTRIADQFDALAEVESFDLFLRRADLSGGGPTDDDPPDADLPDSGPPDSGPPDDGPPDDGPPNADPPDADLVAEWDAYRARRAAAETRAARRKAAALARFDAELVSLPPEEATARVDGDPETWLPAHTVRRRQRERYPDPEGSDMESRLLATIFGGEPPPRSPRELAEERCSRARSAADARDYAAWKATARPPGQRARAVSDARAAVARERAAVEERFARDWGVELPESIFRFWAFLRACGPHERLALEELELCPFGIMDLFDDPARRPRDGIDVRVHGRYYRDPPEFLTFLHGGTDGLHFGLWFDDGRTCDGVASYYTNDGGGVGLPGGTPFTAVRGTLEWRWRRLDDPDFLGEEDDPTRPHPAEPAEQRHRVRLLRDLLMEFETGDRPEVGESFHQSREVPEEVLEHGHPDRLETLDGAGARVGGATAIARGQQKPYDDYDFCTDLAAELTGDAAALDAHVAEALRRCAAGSPADALALGRDLHWISGGDARLETAATTLLTTAYHALARPTLVSIAAAHHRHRALPQVAVLHGQ